MENITIIGSHRNQLSPEQFSDTWSSPACAMFVGRIRQMIIDQQRIVETSAIQTETLRAQGQIAALRRALEIPDILRKELTKGAK